MQRYSFLAALIFFLESEKLALHSDVGKLLQGFNIFPFTLFKNSLYFEFYFFNSTNKGRKWFSFGC